MKLPNKVVSYKTSILPKLIIVLNELQNQDMNISELYKRVHKKITDINEFIQALNILYALHKIELTEDEVISFVGRN